MKRKHSVYQEIPIPFYNANMAPKAPMAARPTTSMPKRAAPPANGAELLVALAPDPVPLAPVPVEPATPVAVATLPFELPVAVAMLPETPVVKVLG